MESSKLNVSRPYQLKGKEKKLKSKNQMKDLLAKA